jgi:hypothetical protein
MSSFILKFNPEAFIKENVDQARRDEDMQLRPVASA